MTDAREMRADGQTTRAIALAARAFGRADAIRTICIRNGMDGNNDRTRQAGRIKVAAERLLTDLKWYL